MDKQHRNPRINQLLGIILHNKQDYAGAAASMRDYLKFAPNAPDADAVKQQLAVLEKQLGTAAGTAQAQ
jgi:regulator of sirC expression with transglutaminase-like and TPR domain